MNVRLRGAVGCLVVALALVCAAKLLAAAPQQGVGVQQKKPNADIENAFRSPEFELKGKLAKIFRLSHCEYISGLTCRIHYNGALALPSELFFTEFDDHGKPDLPFGSSTRNSILAKPAWQHFESASAPQRKLYWRRNGKGRGETHTELLNGGSHLGN
ncbi:MAG: hypothetical protein WA175_05030 [Candidatus Acidiferrales bacterium]